MPLLGVPNDHSQGTELLIVMLLREHQRAFRRVPVEQFYQHPGRGTARQPEVLT